MAGKFIMLKECGVFFIVTLKDNVAILTASVQQNQIYKRGIS